MSMFSPGLTGVREITENSVLHLLHCVLTFLLLFLLVRTDLSDFVCVLWVPYDTDKAHNYYHLHYHLYQCFSLDSLV